MSLGRYSFVPWVRQGLANALDNPTAGSLRATTNVRLTVSGSGGENPVSGTIDQKVELYGPGDIVGLDQGQIIRTEPRHWVTDFEPNYLPYIELYDEGLPWAYSPEAPTGERLKPWLALIVLKTDEHEFRSQAGRPLPFVHVENPDDSLPDLSESWAWAHVHTNESLSGGDVQSGADPATANALSNLIDRDPDLAYARIVCGRRLEPKTQYHAYLVPTFETGRLAGLGLDITQAPGARHGAWRAPYPGGALAQEPQSIPVYFRWQFETSERGDFEYLVRLLKPRPADSRIGRRNIDVTAPGSNISGIDVPGLQGVLRLGGALQVPFDTLSQPEKDTATAYEEWDNPYPVAFQSELAAFLNLGDDYNRATAGVANANSGVAIDPAEIDDPLIVPPIYGQWHARSPRVLTAEDGSALPNDDNWLHEANLDPRHRATANFGTKVIQRHQEDFMKGAWEQVGDVLAANRRMRLVRLGLATSVVFHTVHLQGLLAKAAGTFTQTMYPMARRLMVGPMSAAATIRDSVVPPVMLSSAMRRAVRPRSPLLKRVAVGRTMPTRDIVTRVADGEVKPAPPKTAPESVPKPSDLPQSEVDKTPPTVRNARIAFAGLLLLILVLFFAGYWPLALLLLLVAIFLGYRLFTIRTRPVGVGGGVTTDPVTGDTVGPASPRPAEVDDMPPSPDFALADPYAPTPAPEPTIRLPGLGSDSAELGRYKDALRDTYADETLTATIAPVRPNNPINIATFAGQLLEATDPKVVMPAKFGPLIRIPDRIADIQIETFAPVMAYPEFDTPMYQYLLEISDEHFVPNLQFVQQNSISLLETNQPFIEAYMLGLNHEFCREMHWRSYPTDNCATSFRQFWDVSSYFDQAGTDPEALREELRDIPPIHIWPRASKLGDHDHRDKGGEAENELVLVIRGDLLKRYPNAVIYAQRAAWQTNPDGSINNKVERMPVELTPAQEDNPPESLVKTPIYEAKARPDIYFFGFDLTALEAQGESGDNPGDDPGWFFIIKERPGEPRFGLDIERDAGVTLATWSDLAWPDVSLEAGSSYLEAEQTHALSEPATTDERHEQWEDDRHVTWTPATHAGDLAYVLYQLPVMVAVHAGDMLPRNP
ncbi:hypothetical protein [Erythrobacter sp. JK5]|uniref:hypothetical protein n=1 Tax=Erythrobacter sp. JK5 TaxID=2829500 RepID=UPI001BA9CBEC|nr:hypothetical protein [Erythrobacter sp. JK5]QUL38162.1 hypothetical protein KDC96_01690 [Erythrobacter sp. JK5]